MFSRILPLLVLSCAWLVNLSSPRKTSSPQVCSSLYLPITSNGDQQENLMACRGTKHPQKSFICQPQSCSGITACESCTSQLTNVQVPTIECHNYCIDDGNQATCYTSSNEPFTCTGACEGAAECSDCTLEEQTPSISNTADDFSPKPRSKGIPAAPPSKSGTGVTTWLVFD